MLSLLFLISLPAELLCNSKPLVVAYAGRLYFPIFKTYTEMDFGGHRRAVPDYRSERFRQLVGLAQETSLGQPQAAADHHRILADFDPEPWDVISHPATPASLLDDFDPEPWDVPRQPPAPATILADFDPEPWDVPLPAATAPPRPHVSPAWMLWPPVRYDFAFISTRSQSGRDALAAPWSQTVPTTGNVYASSWVDGHPLGTDDRGRDVFARLVYGFRVSLLFGLLLACSSTLIGAVLGALQGFFGGIVDLLGQRLTEIWGSLPELYLLMILSSLLARNVHVLFVILNLTSWMGMAAYMRAEFLRGRQLDYVTAARALGVSNTAIMFRHILPNSLTPIITFFPFAVSGGILALVSLDFLGLGVPSPYPSLGELLSQGQANLHATWIIVPTFVILSGTITLLTFIGDGLRNAFDPRKSMASPGNP